jgi:hypothetical protein
MSLWSSNMQSAAGHFAGQYAKSADIAGRSSSLLPHHDAVMSAPPMLIVHQSGHYGANAKHDGGMAVGERAPAR